MALLVTLFLVLVNIFNSVTGQAPKSEGLTAVETWVVMCILHVFCVLLEYAVILKIIQNEKRRIVAFRRAMAQQQFYAAVGAGIPINYLSHLLTRNFFCCRAPFLIQLQSCLFRPFLSGETDH